MFGFLVKLENGFALVFTNHHPKAKIICSECNGIWIHNNLIGKRTLNHLASLAKISDIAPALSMKFLDIQTTIECGFTLKRARDMIRTYRQNIFLVFYQKS